MLQKTPGFILIDVLIGVIILSVALVSLASAHKYLVEGTTVTEERTQALVLANREVEELKQYDKYYATSNPAALTLPINKEVNVSGRNYTVNVTAAADNQLESIKNFVKPVQITVTWAQDVGQGDGNASIQLYGLICTKPTDQVPQPPPANNLNHNGWKILTYIGESEADAEKYHGWLHSTLSKQYRLWANYLGNDMSNVSNNYAISSPWSPSNDINKALNSWDSSKGYLTMDSSVLTFGTTDANNKDDYFFQAGAGTYNFSFQVRNDAVIGDDITWTADNPYRNPNEWGLNPTYKTYKLDIYINGTKVAQNVTVVANDQNFNSPTQSLNSNVQVHNNLGVTAKVITDSQGNSYIQFQGIGNDAKNIEIRWSNDEYIPGKKFDANPMFANLTLSKVS